MPLVSVNSKLIGSPAMRASSLIAIWVTLGGGCGQTEPMADASDRAADAAAACADPIGLTIGRCVEQGGMPCSSVTDTEPRFEAVGSGDSVPLVIGFQGAPMFALAVRATGIDPGMESTPESQPRIDAELFDAAEQNLSNYSVSIPMPAVSGEADTYEWLYVFLAVAGAGNELEGQPLTADLRVVDQANTTRCDTLAFTAGALIP